MLTPVTRHGFSLTSPSVVSLASLLLGLLLTSVGLIVPTTSR